MGSPSQQDGGFLVVISLQSGRYAGGPHAAHHGLGLAPGHFERWLTVSEATVATVCAGPAAAFFIDRAHRIADSLQIGLNIGSKALRVPNGATTLEYCADWRLKELQ